MRTFSKMFFLFLLSASLLCTSCNRRPENVLRQKEMVSLIVDLHISDGAFQVKGYSVKKNPDIYTNYRNMVFEKHHTTSENFDESLEWYTRNDIKTLVKIHKEAEKRLNEISEELAQE